MNSDSVAQDCNQSCVAIAGATNAANISWRKAVTVSLFFPPLHPNTIYPTASPKAILYTSQFLLHPETKLTAH